MIHTLYSIQDTMIGFSCPYIMTNEEVAKREYRNFCKKNPNAPDMRLFKVGTFDDESGTVIGVIPECIEGGINNGEDGN